MSLQWLCLTWIYCVHLWDSFKFAHLQHCPSWGPSFQFWFQWASPFQSWQQFYRDLLKVRMIWSSSESFKNGKDPRSRWPIAKYMDLVYRAWNLGKDQKVRLQTQARMEVNSLALLSFISETMLEANQNRWRWICFHWRGKMWSVAFWKLRLFCVQIWVVGISSCCCTEYFFGLLKWLLDWSEWPPV